ncbi:transposase [Microvirga massiliensis]|uniref:transposase n=1 Tax=Microvirga massiliensis TaxID=1033741 RepID=UPI00069BCDD5|nr:transposase [Microvirga massiliensis]
MTAPPAPGEGGSDAARKVKGRKRRITVDTDRRLLMVNLTAADVQDAAGAEAIITAIRQRWPFQGPAAARIRLAGWHTGVVHRLIGAAGTARFCKGLEQGWGLTANPGAPANS